MRDLAELNKDLIGFFSKLTGERVIKIEHNSENNTFKIFMDNRKYYIFICKKCGCQMKESHMGKKCPECGEWTYEHECIKEVKIIKEDKK